ncbi:MAG: hypothetical protein HY319_29025 [Armatimonadetes bacterium]|nr:hypothetical protein [Armatimonadota bacterium]
MSKRDEELRKLREQLAQSFEGVYDSLGEAIQGQSASAARVNRIAGRMDDVAGRMKETPQDMTAFGADLSGQSIRLTRVEKDLRHAGYRLARFTESIELDITDKANRAELEALEARVRRLEEDRPPAA